MVTRHTHRWWTTLLGLGLLLSVIPLQTRAAGYGGEVVWSEDFESGWGDWFTDAGVWDIGKPTSGPSKAHGGQAVGATNLSGNYPADTDSWLISPVITLPNVGGDERLELRYWQWYSYEYRDKGSVQVAKWDGSKWGAWVTLLAPNASETNSTWSLVSADLTAYAGQIVQIAFYHTADAPNESSGWYVDDIQVWKGIPTPTNPETFEFGWGDWYTDTGVWQIGKPTSGPGAAHGGQAVAATNLSGNYPPDTDSRLVSPPVTLPTSPALKLRFWQWHSYEYRDTGSVQIQKWDGNQWGAWTTIATPAASETNTGWTLIAVQRLAEYGGQTVRIAFYHTAGSPNESSGWYIDDVQITPAPETWWIAEDTGVSRTDRLTNDTTPELTFVFPHTVRGNNGDIEVVNPSGLLIVPDSVSGWGTDKVVVSYATPLPEDDRYIVTLKGTITDAQGQAIHGGADRIYHFTLDTTPPAVTCDTLTTEDATPELLGNVDDPDAVVDVTIGVGNNTQEYRVINVGDGTWALPDNIISPELSEGIHIVTIAATDACGNVGMHAAQIRVGPPPSLCELTVSSTDGGSVTAPGEGAFPYPRGTVVSLKVQPDPGFHFVRWKGTAVDAGKVSPNETEPDASVTVDEDYTLAAVFEPSCMAVYDFPMDSNPGWVLDGQWEYGVPTGQRCGAWGNNDPTGGHTGPNVLGVNLNGCYDLKIGGPYYATAGPFDLSGYDDVTLRFWRWLNCDIPEYVKCTIEVSTDNVNWTVLWTQGERQEITDTEWTLCEYRLTQADCQATVYLRWGYQILKERAYAYTGWNIDDVQLIGCLGCDQ